MNRPCAILGALAAVWLVLVTEAHAGAPGQSVDAARLLVDARAAMDMGEHERAVNLAATVLEEARAGGVDRADHAEAWRIHGLAQYFLGRYAEAEVAFFEYLKLDLDGGLDPALVPPEAVAFFEGVRARNAAELRALRPRPRRRRVFALNLVPPAGQFQNGEPVKGWVLAGTGAALLAANVTTYLVLRRWCDTRSGVCESDGQSRVSEARALQTLNIVSGAALIGVYVYGVVDGVRGYGRGDARIDVGVAPMPGGAAMLVSGRF